MTAPDTKSIRALKSKRSKCADVGNIDLSNVPESHETIWLQWGDNGGDDAKAALEAYGREKVREGMQRAADIANSFYQVGQIGADIRAAILDEMENLK